MADYFVKIVDVKTIRRALLSASKETINLLLEYEKLKSLRDEKLENIKEAKELITELKLIIQNLKKLMPKLSEPSDVPLSVAKSTENKSQIKEEFNLEELERELLEIEKKIKKI